MKRKTSTVPTQIWTFGARAPASVSDQEKVREQLFLAHRYYNNLIEIELWRRNEYRAARSALFPGVQEAENKIAEINAEIEKGRTSINEKRSKARKRIDVPEVAVRATTLKQEKKAAIEALKILRSSVSKKEELVAASDHINEEVKKKTAVVRAACGVSWGTYGLVEKAIESAKKSKADPRFRRYQGNGRIGVFIKATKEGFLTTKTVFEKQNRFFQVDPLPDDSCCSCTPSDWSTSPPCGKHRRTYAHLRVSSEGIKPVWLTFPVFFHRDLPAGIIKQAWLKAEKVGTRTQYELQFSVESLVFAARSEAIGIVALDLGWRRMPNGVRVGFLVDDRGHEREILVPERIADVSKYLRDLQSAQSKLFDGARNVLKSRLHPVRDDSIPDSVVDKCKHVALWRSSAKLSSIAAAWVNEAEAKAELDTLWASWKSFRGSADYFSSSEDIEGWARENSSLPTLLVYLDWWRRKNRHLYQWISNVRERGQRQRKDFYRNRAAELAEKYKTIVIEDFDLRAFAEKAEPEETEENYTRRIRNSVSPSELREAITSKFGKDRVVKLDAGDTTAEHYECGHISSWPEKEKKALLLTCQGCGAEYDRDSNAARVLLKRYGESFGNEKKKVA